MPEFQEGDRVQYVEVSGEHGEETVVEGGGTVTKVIVQYRYEVEWDDKKPAWDIHTPAQLRKEQ